MDSDSSPYLLPREKRGKKEKRNCCARGKERRAAVQGTLTTREREREEKRG